MFEFIDTKTLLVVLHLIGVAIGAGGAYMSDAMFTMSVRDEKISRTEFRFLKLGSEMVWIGLVLLIFSGLGLFMQDPGFYLNSTKFLAKMSIVFLLTLNGVIFHIFHIPRIHRHRDEHFPSSDEFERKKGLMLTSGAISITSWTFALILGALSTVPYPYISIMLFYAGVLVIAGILVNSMKNIIIPSRKSTSKH